jgi:hypothetical protein
MIDLSKSLEVTLGPGEMIFVPKSGFNRGTDVLEWFSPLINVASMASYAGAT